LTRNQVDTIKEKFNHIDRDFDGMLDIEEVRLYYENVLEKKRDSFRKVADLFIENNEERREQYERDFDRRYEMAKRCCERNIAHFMKRDLNNDQKVEWKEFLNHEARVIAVAQQEQNKLIL
jgi:Ca2+-binding EF-hand superfamily protein